jgi:curved DNA-binding protein CbpA
MNDAREVLGVGIHATEEEIRAAYLQKIKDHPPESSPDEFERIRDAWETLRDPRRRARSLLLAVDPDAPIAALLAHRPPERRFAGPGPWLAAMKESLTRG